MEHIIHAAYVVRLVHVLLHKLKARFILQMVNVAHAAREQVVHTDNVVALSQQRITQMRPNKSCSACHQYAHKKFPRQKLFYCPATLFMPEFPQCPMLSSTSVPSS